MRARLAREGTTGRRAITTICACTKESDEQVVLLLESFGVKSWVAIAVQLQDIRCDGFNVIASSTTTCFVFFSNYTSFGSSAISFSPYSSYFFLHWPISNSWSFFILFINLSFLLETWITSVIRD